MVEKEEYEYEYKYECAAQYHIYVFDILHAVQGTVCIFSHCIQVAFDDSELLMRGEKQ